MKKFILILLIVLGFSVVAIADGGNSGVGQCSISGTSNSVQASVEITGPKTVDLVLSTDANVPVTASVTLTVMVKKNNATLAPERVTVTASAPAYGEGEPQSLTFGQEVKSISKVTVNSARCGN